MYSIYCIQSKEVLGHALKAHGGPVVLNLSSRWSDYSYFISSRFMVGKRASSTHWI